MKHEPDANTIKLKRWLARRPTSNRKRLRKLLHDQDPASSSITHALYTAESAQLRRQLVKALIK